MRTILSNNALHRLRHIVAEQANDAQAGGQTDYLHLDRLDAQLSKVATRIKGAFEQGHIDGDVRERLVKRYQSCVEACCVEGRR